MTETPAKQPADVLIVDDNPINLRLLTYVMRSQGHHVRHAVDGASTRRAIEERRPDLVLLDVQLPDVDGLDLAREIKAAPSTRAVPVIAVSASAMVGSDVRARDAGCDAFVSKPIDVKHVCDLVASVLASRGTTSA